MDTLLVKPKDKEELLFVQSVLKRMRVKTEVLEKSGKKRRKEEFLDSLESSFKDVERAERGEIKLQSLDEFLHELEN